MLAAIFNFYSTSTHRRSHFGSAAIHFYVIFCAFHFDYEFLYNIFWISNNFLLKKLYKYKCKIIYSLYMNICWKNFLCILVSKNKTNFFQIYTRPISTPFNGCEKGLRHIYQLKLFELFLWKINTISVFVHLEFFFITYKNSYSFS